MPEHPLEALLRERIVILDGAMGTNIQAYKLDEAAYRGERFASHHVDLKGNNDLLCLTRPQVVEDVHAAFLEAGADLIETNTFNSTSLSQADYQLESLAYELNLAAAACARRAARRVEGLDGRRRFVAGAVGPLSKTLSMSREVNDPGARDVTFDEVRAAYAEQVSALLEGGVDVLLVETIFDTLNAKAALFAIQEYFDTHPGSRVPIMISGTITDLSGRTLSGQTVEAFYTSVSHAPLLSIRAELRARPQRDAPLHRGTRAHRADLRVLLSQRRVARPALADRLPRDARNTRPADPRLGRAGLAQHRGRLLRHDARAHPRHRRRPVRDCPPRRLPVIEKRLRLSGLEVLAA